LTPQLSKVAFIQPSCKEKNIASTRSYKGNLYPDCVACVFQTDVIHAIADLQGDQAFILILKAAKI
jgi:hypothetical protein